MIYPGVFQPMGHRLLNIASVAIGMGLLACALFLLMRTWLLCRVRFTLGWLKILQALVSLLLLGYTVALYAVVDGALDDLLVCQVLLWAAVFVVFCAWVFQTTTISTVIMLDRNEGFLRGVQESADGLEQSVEQRTQELGDANERLRGEIRERERLEEQRFEARLQHTQKLESLGVLAGGIAHDFNNLLVGMLGNAGLALLELPQNSPARPAVEQIETAARRAAELTHQLLAYSGIGRFVVEPVDLSKLVSEMLDLLEVSISKKAELQCSFDEALPMIRADASQLRQVIMNLITNASDALEEKPGVVTLRTGSLIVDREFLEDTWASEAVPEGCYVFLEVTDTGRGMDASVKERMFDPFFTTKSTGRGLGLASILGIVRGHKGLIRVDSELGIGTAIKVLMPVSGKPASAQNAAPIELLSWEGGGTVLVADDEEIVRRMVGATLKRSGFDVIEAADGCECLELFKQRRDEIDLVVLDMTMPHLSGEETFKELRRIRPDIPVLLASGYNEQETNQLADKELAGFLQKPFGPNDLLEKMRSLLDLSISSEDLVG